MTGKKAVLALAVSCANGDSIHQKPCDLGAIAFIVCYCQTIVQSVGHRHSVLM